MNIDFDATKNEKNVRERNLPFERVGDFDFGTAIVRQDVRKAYSEPRFVALGMLDDRLHALCFTPTAEGIRVISFRKAYQRDVKEDYEQTIAHD